MQVLKMGRKCELETGEPKIDSSTQFANVLKQVSNEQIGGSTKLAETSPTTTPTTAPLTTKRTTFPVSTWTPTLRSEQLIVQNPTTSSRLSTTFAITKVSNLPEITRSIESLSKAPKITSK